MHRSSDDVRPIGAFVKTATGPDDNLPGEAAGLAWLAEAQAFGGAPVVEVLRVGRGELDHDQPALVRAGGHAVARLHGDLWTGNAFWARVEDGALRVGGDAGADVGGNLAARGGDSRVVLIDPMAYGGHAETAVPFAHNRNSGFA